MTTMPTTPTTTRTGTRSTQTQTRTRTTTTERTPTAQPTQEQIRIRAHQIFLARGGTPGNPVSDWLQAEQELKGRMTLLGRTN